MVLFACIAFVAAAAVQDDAHAETTVLKSDVRPDGFDVEEETSNGIHVDSHGDAQGNIKGTFSYVSPEGETIKVSYTADAEGYHPDNLPTPPPVPAHVIKAQEYIAAHPPKDH